MVVGFLVGEGSETQGQGSFWDICLPGGHVPSQSSSYVDVFCVIFGMHVIHESYD